ncbi:MAG TPA: SNF2-related protein [Blastocatellia bacterium]|nr:SNF2-related protein [Blastocatellia bacterium]
MSLILQLAGEFSAEIRSGGNEYFRQGKVKIKNASPMNLEAEVQGTDKYKVSLWREGNEISVRCSCPYYKSDRLCKHLWAALLTADSENYLKGGSGGAGRMSLVLEDPDDGGYDSYFAESDDEDDDEFDFDDDSLEEDERPLSSRPISEAESGSDLQRSRKKNWREQLAELTISAKESALQTVTDWPEERELLYVIDVYSTLHGQGLMLEVCNRDRRKDGEWSKPKSQRIPRSVIARLRDPIDREILTLLSGGKDIAQNNNFNLASDSISNVYQLNGLLPGLIVPLIARSTRGRLSLPELRDLWLPFEWDEAGPYEFWLEVQTSKSKEQYIVTGSLRRGEETMDLGAPVLMIDDGLLFTREKAARFDARGAFNWISLMRRQGGVVVPASQRNELLGEILKAPFLPKLDLPDELHYTEVTVQPRSRLTIREPEKNYWGQQKLRGELSFDYEGSILESYDPSRGIYQPEDHRFLLRHQEAEQAAADYLRSFGWRPVKANTYDPVPHWELTPSKLPRVVRELLGAGWHIEAEGKVYRRPGKFKIDVKSNIDWFELHGIVDFGDGVTASLPSLLAALRRGENLVKLDDGTYGMLPEEWLSKYGLLAGLGDVNGDQLRFKKAQLGVLDALLASQPEAEFDENFARACEEMKAFEGVGPLEPPEGFIGELRPYQREGLGWIGFLEKFNFGGCLADCMGLGKTVQVLAWLEMRRQLRTGEIQGTEGAEREDVDKKCARKADPSIPQSLNPSVPPSLVVVPKSLVFNWKQEAAKFAPKLRVLDHTGHERGNIAEQLSDYDLILTTYGTLRNDAIEFKDVRFDYIILDEAQAIKNADTASSKAARLLKGNHRLALSGTPIENHLGELWSLFDFLNPGMLGSASVFKLTGNSARNPDDETRKLLSQALRPFILRRTKEQVAKDLPPKLEQTLFCELEPAQRKLYDELRDHYRNSLLGRIESDGLGKSKILILEALLRLRQAACHPGLVNPDRSKEASAKLDMLLPQLLEVIDEGHKVLVFSQFTSFLSILKEHLDAEGVVYEYLDGRTRDRQARVERFQTDPECKLFLISLKAGGLGLNLTAAEYVFLLDPWWNPAVEAQAIDRAHRIGQTQQVFAYRLIARGTVEEKVLELQNTKRDLADAIISADNSLIRSLGKEDLELLLS